MCVSHPAALLLVFAVISIPGGAVDVPELFRDIPDCLRGHCSEMIDFCRQRHGDALTDQLKGCVAEGCEEDIFDCVGWFIEGFRTIGMDRIPPSLPATYRHHNEWIMEKMLVSVLSCSSNEDYKDSMQNMRCIFQDLLRNAEPFINMMSWIIGFSEPGFLSCWMQNFLNVGFSCFHDAKYLVLLANYMNMYNTLYPQDYTRCFAKLFTDKDCFQMFFQVIGSTPEMLAQSKDLFVCVINALVLATTEC